MKLGLTADEVLTTTRAVRKRLDLARPVEREVILECLEIALQAPTGSFSQGWSWMFVTDPDKKRAIADYYGANFDAYRERSRLAAFPDGDLRAERRDAIRSSSDYLRDHFHEVPVLLIPLLEGRLEGLPVFGAASSWGSLLPAVWSFMLALRERGLGLGVDHAPPAQRARGRRAARHPLRPLHPGRAVPDRVHDRDRLQARAAPGRRRAGALGHLVGGSVERSARRRVRPSG